MRRVFYTLALCAVLETVSADEPWSFSKCVEHAITHNITVQKAALETESQEAQLSLYKSGRIPDLQGSASQNFSFGRGLTEDNTYANTNTGTTSINLGASATLYAGNRINKSIEMGRLNLNSALAGVQSAKESITIAVAKAYVEVLYCKSIIEVVQSRLHTDSLQLERLESLFKVGKARQTDVLTQKAATAQSHMNVVEAENNLHLALLSLSQLLELDSPEGFDVARPEPKSVVLPSNPEEVWAWASRERPVIAMMESAVESSKVNVDLVKGRYLPTLSINGGLGTNYYKTSRSAYPQKSFSDQLGDNFGQYIGLQLQVPIIQQLSKKHEIRRADITLQNEKLKLEDTKKSLYKEIQQTYYNAVSSESRLRAAESSAESCRESFALIVARYEEGKESITAYNEAKNLLTEAEASLVKYRFEHLFQNALLSFYADKPIEF